METTNTTKKTIKDLKNLIKELAQQQIVYKEHRKTVRFPEGKERQKTIVERWNHEQFKYVDTEVVLTADLAVEKHLRNRTYLRLLYVAYGLLRGKTLEQIENATKWDEPIWEWSDNTKRQWVMKATENIREEYSGCEEETGDAA